MAPESLVEAVGEHRPDLVGMSALLTTMPGMKKTIEALEEAGLRSRVKVMLGGAPLMAVFAEEIRADVYPSDAASGVEIARHLLG